MAGVPRDLGAVRFDALGALTVLLYSMGASLDGYITDREGDFNWTAPSDELFAVHLERVGRLGAHLCGRRLYEDMLVWETDPSLRDTPDHAAFADVWTALPKVVFSRTLRSVGGNARLASGSVADEVAAVLASTDKDVEIGGADLAAQAFELGLIDELHLFRHPVVVGGGKRYLPAVADRVTLELLDTRSFDNGVIFEHYAVTR